MSPKCYICMEYKTSTWSVCKECLNNRDNKLIEEFLKMFDKIGDSLKEYIDITNTITIDIPLLIEKILNPEKEKWEKRKEVKNE